MALIRWRAEQPLHAFRSELDNLFDSFLGAGEAETPIAPPIDVREDKNHFVVTAELPGVNAKDLNVSVEEGVLRIQGEKKQETETQEGGYHRIERRYGSFVRAIALPVSVDSQKVDAAYRDGVLKITLSKREEAKPKSVQIKVS